jgi:hypothetical protein
MRTSKSRPRTKNNRNNNNRSGVNVMNRVFDSSGPEGKVRGTPQQIIEKYQQLTRDSQLSGDRVAAENFQQHAEHYMRLQAEAQREIDAKREQQDRENREKQAQRDQERTERVDNRPDHRLETRPDNQERADHNNRSETKTSTVSPDVADFGNEPQPDLMLMDEKIGRSDLVLTPESGAGQPAINPKPRVRRRPAKPIVEENRDQPVISEFPKNTAEN